MLRNELKMETGIVMNFVYIMENETYLKIFGNGIKNAPYKWNIEVSAYEDKENNRYRCLAYYSADGSYRKYYLIEFYIPVDVNMVEAIKLNLEEAMECVDFHLIIEEIQKDAEAAMAEAEN